MAFNQQMSFPCELSLCTTSEGLRLSRSPVREIEALRIAEHGWTDTVLLPGDDLLRPIQGELFDIRAEIELGTALELALVVRGEAIHYDVGEETLTCLGGSAPLAPREGRIRLRVLVDRTSLEVFGNQGTVSMSSCFLPEAEAPPLGLHCAGGKAWIMSLEVHELRSAWHRSPQRELNVQ
jgi:sucrose-6-phosphate hydrolase SacC (GH32 family)